MKIQTPRPARAIPPFAAVGTSPHKNGIPPGDAPRAGSRCRSLSASSDADQSVASLAIPERTPLTALPPSDSWFGTPPPSISVPGTVGAIRTFPVPR